jgi:hypothetical protein
MDAFAGPGTQRLTCINAASAEVSTLRPRMRETYRLQWRLDHDAPETLVQSSTAGR